MCPCHWKLVFFSVVVVFWKVRLDHFFRLKVRYRMSPILVDVLTVARLVLVEDHLVVEEFFDRMSPMSFF